MPEAIFVVHLDDYQGFVVEKRYPSTLTLNEKMLNLVYYEHEKEKETNLKFSDMEGMRVVSFAEATHPGWVVCFVLDAEEDYETEDNNMGGMARLILELMSETPDVVNLRDILVNESVLNEQNEEQKLAGSRSWQVSSSLLHLRCSWRNLSWRVWKGLLRFPSGFKLNCRRTQSSSGRLWNRLCNLELSRLNC